MQILVAASDETDVFTEFTGVTRLKQGITPAGVFIDTTAGALGRSQSADGVSSPSAFKF